MSEIEARRLHPAGTALPPPAGAAPPAGVGGGDPPPVADPGPLAA